MTRAQLQANMDYAKQVCDSIPADAPDAESRRRICEAVLWENKKQIPGWWWRR
jgi:hypothetical protein